MTDNRIIINERQKTEIDFWRNVLKLNTSIPAIVDEFDPVTQRVSAIPAIRGKYLTPDNRIEYIPLPKIINIPISIIKTAGLKITYPIKKGDNCTLIFSQRSLDNFLIEGGIQDPFDTQNNNKTTLRCMDITDAMCFPGLITNKEIIQDYSMDAIEIRSADNTTKVSVKENSLNLVQGNAIITMEEGNISMTAETINITGSTAVNITSPSTSVGSVTTIDEKEFVTHVHTGVTSGGSNTGGVA